MTTLRDNLTCFLDDLMTPNRFVDYGPNGLQVEGCEVIENVAFAVSATRESITEAAARGANALIVHHGLFWKFHGARPIVGPLAQRIGPLMQARINLYGYHLPLDAHMEIGNAAQLANRIGMHALQPFGDHHGASTGVWGALRTPCNPRELERVLKHVLEHPVIVATPDPNARLNTVGIITGGANSGWKDACQTGLDAFITGEISEHDWHDSQEAGMHMFAGGHYATEQFGIQALMARVEAQFALPCFFIPSANPA